MSAACIPGIVLEETLALSMVVSARMVAFVLAWGDRAGCAKLLKGNANRFFFTVDDARETASMITNGRR